MHSDYHSVGLVTNYFIIIKFNMCKTMWPFEVAHPCSRIYYLIRVVSPHLVLLINTEELNAECIGLSVELRHEAIVHFG